MSAAVRRSGLSKAQKMAEAAEMLENIDMDENQFVKRFSDCSNLKDEDLREIFRLMDTDRSKTLSVKELISALEGMAPEGCSDYVETADVPPSCDTREIMLGTDSAEGCIGPQLAAAQVQELVTEESAERGEDNWQLDDEQNATSAWKDSVASPVAMPTIVGNRDCVFPVETTTASKSMLPSKFTL